MMKTVVLSNDKIHTGTLLLVNARCPMKYENKKGLLPANINFPDIRLDRDAANALQFVLEKISAKDKIIPVSGYRSVNEQTEIYNNSLKENGETFTKKFVALPNRSEHQTGLAFDLTTTYYDGLWEGFADTAEGKWVAANCHKYGFIIRYPKEKEHITGYMYEPWHVRYIGVEKATLVYESGLCLEEYLNITSSYAN